VHSLGAAGDFGESERQNAREFAAAARECALQRVVYLGGIAHGENLSPHLPAGGRSARSCGRAACPQSSCVSRSSSARGSASFELVRTVVERLPSIVAPDWLDRAAQPIALDDVVAALVAALDVPLEQEAVYEGRF
jgi:hypothetical protein